MNERVWGFLRVRHMFYLFLAVIFLWCDYSACSLMILVMGTVAGALALLSGLFPRGFVVMLIYSTLLSNYSK